MLACKEIVEIVASNQKLTLVRKVELKFHLLMCKHCNGYVEQLKTINEEHIHQLEDQVIEHIKNIHDKKNNV